MPLLPRLTLPSRSYQHTSNLGETTYTLGIQITRNCPAHSISLCQKQYILDMLHCYKLFDCNPLSTPMEPGLTPTKDMGATIAEDITFMTKVPYLKAVGSLMYLATTTCPDISFTVGVLAHFNSNPGVAHWKAVKHLFRYLKGTLDYHRHWCTLLMEQRSHSAPILMLIWGETKTVESLLEVILDSEFPRERGKLENPYNADMIERNVKKLSTKLDGYRRILIAAND
jgi:hypothetical protein